MNDYIKRSDAVEEIRGLDDTMFVCVSKDECHGMRSMKERAMSALERISPADVRPMVRGEWIGVDCSYWRSAPWGAYPVNRIRYKCSVCGRIENQKEPFCNCGAYMQKED